MRPEPEFAGKMRVGNALPLMTLMARIPVMARCSGFPFDWSATRWFSGYFRYCFVREFVLT
jgi:hypothetical protein